MSDPAVLEVGTRIQIVKYTGPSMHIKVGTRSTVVDTFVSYGGLDCIIFESDYDKHRAALFFVRDSWIECVVKDHHG